jgi:multimeric flavodoxin WrbA
VQLLVLVAGTNEPSNSNVLADAFIEGMKRVPGTDVTKIRLKDLRIEHFDLKFYTPNCSTEDDFCKLQDLLVAADGVVIASPIWNFSVPAHLKNVIDRIGAFGLDTETRTRGQLKSKPFFFLFTGGAPVAVWKGVMRFTTSHVPEAFRYYGGAVIGRHYEGRAMVGRGTFGLILDKRPESLERARRKGERFARIVKQFKEQGTLPLTVRVYEKLYRFGVRVMSKL